MRWDSQLAFLGLGGATDLKGACPSLEGAKPHALVAYLEGQRSTLDDRCILYSLEQLGAHPYPAAMTVLLKYLDYRVPEPPRSNEPDRGNLAEGVAMLNRAGREATDPGVHKRLLDAAREAAGKCPGSQRAACFSVAAGQSPHP